MKLNRQLAMLMYLLNHGQATAVALAERFEVSTRTIRRDMEDLSQAGIPIYAAQGAGGGIRLMEGYSLSRVLLDESEQVLLVSALSDLSRSQDIGAGKMLDKLGALWGERSQEEWLRVDYAAWGISPRDARFGTLRDAIQDRRLVRFLYTDPEGAKQERTVEPMTLLYRGTSWYVWGWCRLRADYRLFRLSRISKLTMLGDSFIRREKRLEEAETDYPSANATVFRLQFAAAASQRVFDFFAAECITRLADGRLAVEVAWPMNDWVTGSLLSFGPELTVLSPVWMRELLEEKARQIIANYRERQEKKEQPDEPE